MDLKMVILLKLAQGSVKDVLTRGVHRCEDKFEGEFKYLEGEWMDDFLVCEIMEG